jgi:hypothetical protein
VGSHDLAKAAGSNSGGLFSLPSCVRNCKYIKRLTKRCGESFDPSTLSSNTQRTGEQWKIVFEVYAGHPVAALTLAYQLIAIKQSLQRGQKGIPDAIVGLDMAIDGLYPHTDFHKMGHKFYHRTIEGTLKPEQEEKLRQLGVKL